MYPTGLVILFVGVGLLMHHSKDAPPSATPQKEDGGAPLLPIHHEQEERGTVSTAETTNRTGGALRHRNHPAA